MHRIKNEWIYTYMWTYMYTYTCIYICMHKYMSTAIIAFAYDMFGIFCGICRNQPMALRFYFSVSCTCLEKCVYIRFCFWHVWNLLWDLPKSINGSYILLLVFITCDRPPFERQRQRQRQAETDNPRQIDRQTDRETQRTSERKPHRHQVTKRNNTKDRQTNRRIDLCLSLSRSFRSMLGQVHALAKAMDFTLR